MQKLYRWTFSHAIWCSALAALTITIFVLFCAGLLSLYQESTHIQQQQAQASLRLTLVSQEIGKAFNALDSQISEECSNSALSLMRQTLVNQRYIRAFGMLNTQGQLICITNEGVLQNARPLPPANLQLSKQNSWFNYPINPVSPHLTMNLVSNGRFIALIDRHLSEEILQQSNVDAIWVYYQADSQTQFKLVWSNLTSDKLINPLYPTLRYSEKMQHWSSIDWKRIRIVFGSNVANTGYFLQNYLPFNSILQTNPITIYSVLIFAALIGALFGFFVKHKIEQRSTLEFRINELCESEHILCMYQPIIDLRTGGICGCEVLMRIQDSENIIFPDQLIPLVRAQNLNWKLDSTVATKALLILQQHLPSNAPKPFKVALNFFPENITHTKISSLLSPLNDSRFLINIEVTEYGLSEDLFADVKLLRQDGYLISVDDFGTGYSNLGTVKRLTPDFLKIDKSFVFDMEDKSLRSSLIPEIIAIANAVGAEVIAEGIENASQVEQLKEMGVQYGQGYWFGRPVQIKEFIKGLNSPTHH